ncbi:hydrolase [Thecamonas trahens ATCC 50062]|uniref:Hydrolase n=1 Tax=Thecamonas trahens ATCC 50062 TaxID=461836 RepID=A0A0L0DRM5_THETB|nr:hydrolase [Thecamonas trahens ATCC 50062]KNC54907.1 hydrolase [Thecamonas trahens ATCC 50062]|eukprot:XP_013753497.1 hydrolase [Thecamonas trahens ATCC 50062]
MVRVGTVMAMAAVVAVVALAAVVAEARGAVVGGADDAQHVIVLMMENHSFDNVFGFLPGVGSLSTEVFNYVEAGNMSSERVNVTRGAPYCVKPDPIHIVPDVGDQVTAPNSAFGHGYAPTMGGFVENFVRRTKATRPAEVMAGYTPEQLPVLSALARNFRVYTRWHSAVAGSTGINRLFAHAGTSGSYTGGEYEAPGLKLEAPTLFEALMAEGVSTRIEYVDFCSAHAIKPLADKHRHIFSRSHKLEAFFTSLREGTLANYTWVVPQLLPALDAYPTSMHPSGDIRAGEALIKNVVESLMASQYWNDTILLITFDEHGGFHDTAPPPGPGVGSGPVPDPNPDIAPHPYTYDFTRLGVRVPTLLVSPWVDAGVDDTLYWGSSVPATVAAHFGLTSPPLTSRIAAAPRFNVDLRSSPRAPSSYPAVLPEPAPGPYCRILRSDPAYGEEFLSMYQTLLDEAGICLPAHSRDVTTAYQAHQWLLSAIAALFGQ